MSAINLIWNILAYLIIHLIKDCMQSNVFEVYTVPYLVSCMSMYYRKLHYASLFDINMILSLVQM